MGWQAWIPSLTTATVVSLIWAFAGWALKLSFEKSLQGAFDAKLEAVRSDFRKEEEVLKAGLRANDEKLAAIRSGALANMAQREAELDRRRRQALENLWQATTEFAPYKTAAKYSEAFKLDELMKVAAGRGRDADGSRELAAFTLKIAGLEPLTSVQKKPEHDRPFISPVVWAMFAAYRSVVLNPAIKLLAAKNGVGPHFFKNDEGLVKIATAAMPHHAASFEKFGSSFLIFLPEEMEEKLLRMIVDALNGVEQDAAAVANANKIIQDVARLEAEGKMGELPIPEALRA